MSSVRDIIRVHRNILYFVETIITLAITDYDMTSRKLCPSRVLALLMKHNNIHDLVQDGSSQDGSDEEFFFFLMITVLTDVVSIVVKDF